MAKKKQSTKKRVAKKTVSKKKGSPKKKPAKKSIAKKRPGLWANIHAKQERVKAGSGEKMRKPGQKGAPTAKSIRKSQK